MDVSSRNKGQRIESITVDYCNQSQDSLTSSMRSNMKETESSGYTVSRLFPKLMIYVPTPRKHHHQSDNLVLDLFHKRVHDGINNLSFNFLSNQLNDNYYLWSLKEPLIKC